jgi:hypothetical protein
MLTYLDLLALLHALKLQHYGKSASKIYVIIVAQIVQLVVVYLIQIVYHVQIQIKIFTIASATKIVQFQLSKHKIQVVQIFAHLVPNIVLIAHLLLVQLVKIVIIFIIVNV